MDTPALKAVLMEQIELGQLLKEGCNSLRQSGVWGACNALNVG